MIPLEAVVVLTSTVAPSIFKLPIPARTIPYEFPALLSLIVTLVLAPVTVIFAFIYRSPNVPLPLFSKVTLAPSDTLKAPPSSSKPPSFPEVEQFLITNVPPLTLVVLPPDSPYKPNPGAPSIVKLVWSKLNFTDASLDHMP